MSDVIDLLEPSQDAVFVALAAAVPADLAKVFVVVPQDTAPNFIQIGALDSEPDTEIAEQLEKITVEVQYIYRGQDRSQLLRMMQAGRAAIDRKILPPQDGAEFGMAKCAGSSASTATGDGVTFAGIQNFVFWAQPTG
uniref:hypothetical protein n=1 Tax=uncultured Sphingomonas sp. TaxID=158754 RepID=UPI0035C96816